MRTMFMSLSLIAIFCTGCGDDAKPSSTPISTNQPSGGNSKKNVIEKLTMQQAIDAVAEKPSKDEVFLSAEKVRSFDIAGIRLGMTQVEVEKLLKEGHWQGKFSQLPTNLLADSSVKAFEQDGKDLFIFRNRNVDGALHIAEIQFVQRYELEHLEADISKALIEKYGTPTYISGNRLIWRIRHEAENDMRDSIGGASQHHVCYRTDSPQLCLDTLKKIEFESRNGPKLVADISAKEVHLSLSDRITAEKEVEAVKSQLNKAVEVQRKENGKQEEVNF